MASERGTRLGKTRNSLHVGLRVTFIGHALSDRGPYIFKDIRLGCVDGCSAVDRWLGLLVRAHHFVVPVTT